MSGRDGGPSLWQRAAVGGAGGGAGGLAGGGGAGPAAGLPPDHSFFVFANIV